MECDLGRSGDGGSGVKKEEKSSEYSIGDDEGRHKQETVIEEPPAANPERSMVEAGPSESTAKKEEDVDGQLETTKAQMGEVREENQRLKMRLHKIMMEYRALEKQFHDMVVKQETKKNINADQEEIIEEAELVSLSLGRVPSSNNNNPKNEEKVKVVVSKLEPLKDEEYYFKEDLALGLDCKFETSKSGSTTDQGLPNNNNNNNPISPVNSTSHDEVPKEEEAGESTDKALNKTMRDNTEDEVAAPDQQTPAKKARVCVRARCDTPTMNDGCQWRKYGQKIAKGNPCPRAYYRCTVAPSCPVRKQVQRCVEDMSILITTYEGTHNHTLPFSAHAMASTTSAAASMLLSGSSTSHSASMPSTLTAANNNLHGLNFYLSDGSKPKQLYLSNPPLSSSPSHPTITLDLTSNPTGSSSTSPFVRFTPTYNNQPSYPSSMSLNFSSTGPSESNNTMSWNNKGFLNYGTRNTSLGTVNFGRPTLMENLYQSYMQKSNINSNNPTPPQGHDALPDTSISAATKAITADPTFQSALAVALSSFIGSSTTTTTTPTPQGNHHQGTVVGENLGQKMKWAEMFIPPSSTLPSSTSNNKVNGCASTFLNKTHANTQTTGNLMSLSPSSLPFSTSKSASASPDDNNNNDGDTN